MADKVQSYLTLLAACSADRLRLIKDIEEHIDPILEWPQNVMEALLCAHVKHGNRRQLIFFWAVNGLQPMLLYLWAKAQPGWLKHKESALHMATEIRNWQYDRHTKCEYVDGEWQRVPYTAWCMATKTKEPVVAPWFATDDYVNSQLGYVSGASYWSDTIELFQEMAKRLLPKGGVDHAQPRVVLSRTQQIIEEAKRWEEATLGKRKPLTPYSPSKRGPSSGPM